MASKHTLSYQLLEIIESRGHTAYALGQLASVDPGIVSRWMTGRRDIRLETADRIAECLGLRIVETARSRPTRPTRPASRTPRPTGRPNPLMTAIVADPGEVETGPDDDPTAVDRMLGNVEIEPDQAAEVEPAPDLRKPQIEPTCNLTKHDITANQEAYSRPLETVADPSLVPPSTNSFLKLFGRASERVQT